MTSRESPLLAVLALELAGLEAAVDEDLVALPKLVRRALGTVAEDADPIPVGALVHPATWPSGRLWLTATLNWVTGFPAGVYRISGSRPDCR